MNVLTVKNISKYYQTNAEKIHVLNDVSFELKKGEMVALRGPSGIGKTTLLNIIGTLDKPDSGEIIINDQNPFSLNDREISLFRNKHLGFIFQFHHLLPEFTALENVLIPARISGLLTSEMEAYGHYLLKAVGLEHRLHHKPAALSGGERQRTAIARALINKPDLVLADEPTGNLDPHNSEKLIELIVELKSTLEQSFLIATHSRQLADATDRIIEMI
jgi:lipoprotein-releasing system ATP-binding protein